MMRRIGNRALALLGCGLAFTLLGCPAFNSVDRDIERTPVVNAGAGASIIYPGQAPAMPPSHHPRQAPAPGTAPGSPAEAQPRSSGGPPGSGITMIGGSMMEEERHQKIEEEPGYWKYVMLPFAIVAAPFVYVYDTVKPEHEAGPAIPTASAASRPQAPPGPPPVDYETQQLEAMERELAGRGGSTPPPSATQPMAAPHARLRPAEASISDELAALRASAEGGTSPHTGSKPPRPAPSGPAPADPSLLAASGHVDRNGDGQTDHWIFRDAGEISRELFDEDFDGRPDRSLHYDLATHQVARIEEDADRDGRADTWTSLREGHVVGRRADANEDGEIDTWTFYRDGAVTRVERDASGNGFRDHVAHYVGGKLSREERDEDGDGIPDLVTHYDDQERVSRVEEDANGDGHLDVVSHYEGGRLKSRELRDASLLHDGAPR